RWKPFRETNAQLQKLAKKYRLGLLSNIDDKLLGQTRRHIPTDFDLVVTAQQVRSYKPEPAHFTECARRIGGKRGWVHVSSSYYHDVVPCLKQRVPVIWVNRTKETLDASQKKPTATPTLAVTYTSLRPSSSSIGSRSIATRRSASASGGDPASVSASTTNSSPPSRPAVSAPRIVARSRAA